MSRLMQSSALLFILFLSLCCHASDLNLLDKKNNDMSDKDTKTELHIDPVEMEKGVKAFVGAWEQMKKNDEDGSEDCAVIMEFFNLTLRIGFTITNWVVPGSLELWKAIIMQIVQFRFRGYKYTLVALSCFIANLVLLSQETTKPSGTQYGFVIALPILAEFSRWGRENALGLVLPVLFEIRKMTRKMKKFGDDFKQIYEGPKGLKKRVTQKAVQSSNCKFVLDLAVDSFIVLSPAFLQVKYAATLESLTLLAWGEVRWLLFAANIVALTFYQNEQPNMTQIGIIIGYYIFILFCTLCTRFSAKKAPVEITNQI